MSGLNEPLALPQSSHALTEMPPMEALYAAFAGAAGEPQHELTLDPAAMDIHDGDEVSIVGPLLGHHIEVHMHSAHLEYCQAVCMYE